MKVKMRVRKKARVRVRVRFNVSFILSVVHHDGACTLRIWRLGYRLGVKMMVSVRVLVGH